MESNETCPGCRVYKATPRSEETIKDLQLRLKRLNGQLAGIGKMLDDNRYCAEILTQIAACERALQEVGYIVLKEHLATCVSEDLRAGKEGAIDETLDLLKKLK